MGLTKSVCDRATYDRDPAQYEGVVGLVDPQHPRGLLFLGDGLLGATDGDLDSELWDRFHRPKPKQAWYYRSIVATIRAEADSEPLLGMADRLARAVDALFASGAEV